jgi:hypothetical protein
VAYPPTLADPTLDDQFRDLGYVVVDLIDEHSVSSLREVCDRFHPEPQSTWECDFYTTDRTCKETVAAAMAQAFEPAIQDLFVGHEPYCYNFVINWPGPDGGLVLHEHSSTVDERFDRSAVIWCAVTETTEENGTLHVVPRSHQFQIGPKAERGPGWFHGHEPRLLRDHLTSVPLRAGQALIFDNALLHCSFANHTDAPRIAAVATIARRDAQLRYHEWSDEGQIDVYQLSPAFFMETVAADFEFAPPTGLPPLEQFPGDATQATLVEIASLPPGTCSHG